MSETKMQLTEEHKEFLVDLRDSGVTNMYGASPYVQLQFGLNTDDSISVVSQWMATFSE